MTRAHAPDCGAFFAGRCDCAVGALEEMVAYATKADERIAELTAEPAARTRDAALARCEREEKERKEANARVVRLQEALATTVKGRDEANARADAAEQRAVAALAQVEHFRRRLDAEAMRANEAAKRARDATNLRAFLDRFAELTGTAASDEPVEPTVVLAGHDNTPRPSYAHAPNCGGWTGAALDRVRMTTRRCDCAVAEVERLRAELAAAEDRERRWIDEAGRRAGP